MLTSLLMSFTKALSHMTLLRAGAVGAPDLGPVPTHKGPSRLAGQGDVTDYSIRAAEHPMPGVGTLGPHTGLIRGDDPGLAQRRDASIALGPEGTLASHRTLITPPR